MATEHSMMIRAAITSQEWARIRKLAIDRKMSASALVAELLRKGMRDGR